ncbi:MAG TPA: FAD-dependent monooxygenase [Chthoniobacteraceae bacterium]|nr:FAD-dependent monooxygenase [Chthoniobacteraceae bacterium]
MNRDDDTASSGPPGEVDVCIIGGGPAGSAVGSRLASLGHRVCLVEAHAFPRPGIEATLPAAILPLLEFIGARERVERAGFPRAHETLVWWSEPLPAGRPAGAEPGFYVDRGKFDLLLLENAREKGVEILQPARASLPVRTGGEWQVPVEHSGGRRTIAARVLIDAAGRANPLGGAVRRPAPPLLAMYAYWKIPGALQGCVEAGDDEWYWAAPAGRDRALAAVFLDPLRLRAVAARDRPGFYLRLLERFRLFAGGQGGSPAGEVRVCDASFCFAEEPSGAGLIRVGDASMRLDPLSSQGVLSAIAGGIQAAAVANTFLRRPEDSGHAGAFYLARQRERVASLSRAAAGFYREKALQCDRPFWRARMGPAPPPETPAVRPAFPSLGSRVRLSSGVQFIETPVLKGDLIGPAPAFSHPSLSTPVAYLAGVETVPLLTGIRRGETLAALLEQWREIPPDLAREILHWLWAREIIVADG